jgi:hypothetical protein
MDFTLCSDFRDLVMIEHSKNVSFLVGYLFFRQNLAPVNPLFHQPSTLIHAG